MERVDADLRAVTLLVAPTACALTAPAQQSAPAGGSAEDEAAIRRNVKRMESEWNAKSGASYAGPFAEDADFVIINGMHLRGRAAIEKNHQQIFSTIYKSTTVGLAVKQIRFLRPDVALVHVSGRRDAPGSERELVTDATMVMVMMKGGGRWKIASFQNTKVSGPPPSR